MRPVRIIFYSLLSLVLSCKGNGKENLKISETNAERIAVDDSVESDAQISEFIAPYKKHLNETLDSIVAYNPNLLSKNNGDLNTAIGNLMADIVMLQAGPVIKRKSGRNIDLVLLNHGGIRSELPKGGINARSAYKLMPFENEIVVAELTGKQINQMLRYLEKAKTAHPVSGIEIKADKNYKIFDAKIQGEKIDENKTYLVATSDYLLNGGDNMAFFKDPVNIYGADYKIRNAIIDYFNKTDTIKAEIDQRYIRE